MFFGIYQKMAVLSSNKMGSFYSCRATDKCKRKSLNIKLYRYNCDNAINKIYGLIQEHGVKGKLAPLESVNLKIF